MIKYIKSTYHRGAINEVIPTGLSTSITYINKSTSEIIWRVESDNSNLIDSFVLSINGVEVPKPTTVISPIKLMTLFPLDKIMSIRASTDPGIIAILNILDDPRLLEIDRNQLFFINAITYISSIISLSANEISNVLTGD